MHDVLALQLEGRKRWRICQSKKDVDLSLSIELNLHLLNKKKYQEFCLKKVRQYLFQKVNGMILLQQIKKLTTLCNWILSRANEWFN